MKFLAPIIILGAAIAWPAVTAAQVEVEANISAATPLAKIFEPNPQSQTRISYENWDEVLGFSVLYMGESTRLRADTNPTQSGTRIRKRVFKSPYRLEGNKVLYPYIEEDVSEAFRSYVDEFVALANRLDITTLPRDEQLAFWINLHNSVVLREINENYPGPRKDIFKIQPASGGGEDLHDAPLVNIKGVSLSLRDIREKIVFPNWPSPDVAFAFHLGNAGGPSMRTNAYKTPELKAQIEENAHEYVNALRGYDGGEISQYFIDIAPWYFPYFERDLAAYFKTRMDPNVYAEFQDKGITKIHRPENSPADVTGGFGASVFTSNLFGADPATFDFKAIFARERVEKIEVLQEQGRWRTGRTRIIDEETEGGSDNPSAP